MNKTTRSLKNKKHNQKTADKCFEIISEVLEMVHFVIATGLTENMTPMELVQESFAAINDAEEDSTSNLSKENNLTSTTALDVEWVH